MRLVNDALSNEAEVCKRQFAVGITVNGWGKCCLVCQSSGCLDEIRDVDRAVFIRVCSDDGVDIWVAFRKRARLRDIANRLHQTDQ
jgi:alpha-D-ribose 1-methylphosphonate 5-phosphate C-P lyase